jgi:outer membrane lipoprotein-sorting protein
MLNVEVSEGVVEVRNAKGVQTLKPTQTAVVAPDGVLCEGIETTDASGLPFASFTGRLWVAVATGYPVLAEIEAVDGGGVRHTTTLDQFRWNVDLAAEGVEPQIPTDYDPL